MLKQRVFTALFLVAALFLVLFKLPAGYAVAVFLVVALLAGWEWSRLMTSSTPARFVFPLAVLLACWVCLQCPLLRLPFCMIAAVFWLLVPFWLIKRWHMPGRLLGWVVGLVVIVPTWIGMMSLHAFGPWILLAAMALVWVADISAYFVGRAIGRHKLAPAVSPGKTWEGAAGAVLGALLYVFLLRQFAEIPLPSSIFMLVIATILFVAISIIGDLFESMIKRQAGVKDSSQLLPGHGGILDRIDSLTSTLPLLVAGIGIYAAFMP